MSRRLYPVFGAVVTAFFLMTSLAFAQQVRWIEDREHRPGWSQLDEQANKEFLERKQAHHLELYPKRQEMVARQAELNALLASQDPDEGRVEELKSELVRLNQEIFEMRLEHRIENRQGFELCAIGKGPGRPGRGAGWQNKGGPSGGFSGQEGYNIPGWLR